MLQIKQKSSFGSSNLNYAPGTTVNFTGQTCFFLVHTNEGNHVIFYDQQDPKKGLVSILRPNGRRNGKQLNVELDWLSSNVMHVLYPGNNALIVTEDGIYAKQFGDNICRTIEVIATNAPTDDNALKLSSSSLLSLEERACFFVWFNRDKTTILIQDDEATNKAKVVSVSNNGGKILSESEITLDWKESGKLKCRK